MSKLEKKICIIAVVFIVVYIGAIFITLNSRVEKKATTSKIESVQIKPEERTFMVAELLLPMAILSTLVICFIIVKKRRLKDMNLLDDNDNDNDDDDDDEAVSRTAK